MKIAGIQKNSFLDYPGLIAAVIFTQGCNMNCSYCHNKGLIPFNLTENQENYIKDFLLNRKGLIDAIVISGGEPLLQKDIIDYLISINDLGYKIKIDTNGTMPEKLKKVIEMDLVDYVGMDIKAPLDKYDIISKNFSLNEKITESINILLNSNIEYEFRTTFCEELNQNDILEISQMIRGANKYVIQQCRKINTDEESLTFGDYTGNYVTKSIDNKVFQRIKSNVKNIEIKGEIDICTKE